MRVGDVLEWFGAACFAAVAYGYGGWRPAAGAVGVAFVYFGQCYATHALKVTRPKLSNPLSWFRKG